MASKKENREYKLLNDNVARPLFKNSPVSKELTAIVVSQVLKVDYNEIINNMKLISEDMLFSTKSIDGRTDMNLETDAYYVNIEFCYTRGSNRQKQMNSYVFGIFLKQVRKTKNYKNMKNILQIMIENYDYFGRGEFSYEVGFMEKNLHIPEDDLITKFHLSLDNLRKIDYTSIRNEKDVLKRLLYMFVCDEENLEKAYRGDKFMEKVIKTAKEIAGKESIPLYLSEEEIRKLDREEAVQEGYDAGKIDARTEMIMNMCKKGWALEHIADGCNLTIEEVQKIIDSNKE